MSANQEDLTIENLFPKMMFALTIYKYKYMAYLVKSILVLWLVGIMVQCVYCIQTATFQSLLQYGPMLFFYLFVSFPLLTLAVYHRWIVPMSQYRNKFSRNFNTGTTNLKKKILYEAYNIERFFIIDMLLHVAALIIYAITIINRPSLRLSSALLLELYFPQILVPILLLYDIMAFILMMLFWLAPYYAIILESLLKYQVYLLNEQVLCRLGENRRTLEHNQNNVQENLIFIIKWHQEILMQHSIARELAVIGFLTFSVAVLCTTVFTALVTFSPFYGPHHVIIILFMTVWKLFYLTYMTQDYENVSEEIQPALYDLDWYTWNSKNRRIFTILFLNSSRTLTIGYMSLRVNNEFFKQTMKIIYTLGNVMNNMSSK